MENIKTQPVLVVRSGRIDTWFIVGSDIPTDAYAGCLFDGPGGFPLDDNWSVESVDDAGNPTAFHILVDAPEERDEIVPIESKDAPEFFTLDRARAEARLAEIKGAAVKKCGNPECGGRGFMTPGGTCLGNDPAYTRACPDCNPEGVAAEAELNRRYPIPG